MLTIGSLAFLAPWLLSALVILPVLWLILRLMPPAPRRQLFPALRLLLGLENRQETPARTPWWILLLRTLMLAAAILALADPVLDPQQDLEGDGPLVLVMDNDWAAARDWTTRNALVDRLLDEAAREDRQIYLLATARDFNNTPLEVRGPLTVGDARALTNALDPQPWPADRQGALEALAAFAPPASAHAVWLSNGLQDAATDALVERLQALGRLTVFVDAGRATPVLVRSAVLSDGILTAPVHRAHTATAQTVVAQAVTARGGILERVEVSLPVGEAVGQVQFDLPAAISSQIDRVILQGEGHAGATLLLDDSLRRRAVGLFEPQGGGGDRVSPLLGELHFIEQALQPYNPVFRGSLEQLLEQKVSVLVMADIGVLTETELARLQPWLEQGGVLIRFAGPRMAAAQIRDPLIPVPLVEDSRTLGGALSWAQPAALAPFPEASPLAGIGVASDIRVERQVLAQPVPDLAERSWATLEDGTPLITARRQGQGTVVLVHTTANTRWSNLALSGTFVEMLRRMTELSVGAEVTETRTALQPVMVMDGFGRLIDPAGAAGPIPPGGLEDALPSPPTPPGLYQGEGSVRALNLARAVPDLVPLARLPASVAVRGLEAPTETSLKAALLIAAAVLLMVDVIASMLARGVRLSRRRPARAVAGGGGALAAALLALVMVTVAAGPDPAHAEGGQEAPSAARPATPAPPADGPVEDWMFQAADQFLLAHVQTGDARVDQIAQEGLEGLASILVERTSVDAGQPRGIDIETDELSFYAMLYWPVTRDQAPISDAAIRKLNDYMRRGGTIVFDTRDANQGGSAMGSSYLQRLVGTLDVPPLVRIPDDHVLTRSFYLLDEFPGRYAGGDVWVEAAQAQRNDGVSSIVIGAADWASAWARRPDGRPLYPVSGGGQRQRTYAERWGVNLVMYVLTGNYKADQVHIPHILQRLGQ